MGREKEKVIYTEDSMRRRNMSLIGVSKGEKKKGIKMQRQEFSISDERQCSHTGLKIPSKVKKKKI